jgi:starch phosphorylase
MFDSHQTRMFSKGSFKTIHKYTVSPSLPEKLKFLSTLAYNLWYVWDRDGLDLFRRLDRDLWDECYHNPVALLGRIDQERLEELAADESFLANIRKVEQDFRSYREATPWFERAHAQEKGLRVAYFSLEFGLNEAIRIYSGGLGMLAGDHLKSSSDIGLPLVGVGLLYREGYFHQYLNIDGWQQETYPDNDLANMPVCKVNGPDDAPLLVSVDLPGRTVFAEIWRVDVGRTALYLLNANIEKNSPPDREITAQLYGGDSDMRIKQEILLGIGGMRALAAMELSPAVAHMNEGHAAFLSLERTRMLMEQEGLDFHAARKATASSCVFTTHTPVKAGIDVFSTDQIRAYLGHYVESTLGLSVDELLGLGRRNPFDSSEPFSMAVLAIRMSHFTNGVSRLHGEVSRSMWSEIWPDVSEDEVPIESVTNGVHHSSWISYDMSTLLDRYLGPRWIEEPDNPEVWKRVAEIPYTEIWRTHERRRERLVAVSRKALHRQLLRRGATSSERNQAWEVLDPQALTIGFARRFATYKRSTLLFRDIGRLEALCANADRPVQFIFAGKAHPRDVAGKELIKTIVSIAQRPSLRRRIVFLENYDMNIARYLVQGADVWLNTPRRPLEASGTSGMKATYNGVLNLSVLDGWWCEGHDRNNGWAIGAGETYRDAEYQDEVESKALYKVLEDEVVPLFYDRGADGMPRKWIDMMRDAFRSLCPVYNTHRMVKEYTERFYLPCLKMWENLRPDGFAKARELARWEKDLYASWEKIFVGEAVMEGPGELRLGDAFELRVPVKLGDLGPEDVTVELYYGPLDAEGRLRNGAILELTCEGEDPLGHYLYRGEVACTTSGRHGFAARVVPNVKKMRKRFKPGLIAWG